jgi:signal peptidase I
MGIGVCTGAIYALMPGQPPLFIEVPILFGGIAAWIAFFFYRVQLSRNQRELNSKAAELTENHDFILYLRPFLTSGALPVPCLLPSRIDRCLTGRFWDLELALSLALTTPTRHLVAVGEIRKSYGAAKLIAPDDHWKKLVDTLALSAKVITIFPYNRPGTLWETLDIFNNERLLAKTIFIMPPRTLWQSVAQTLIPWRRGHASRWHDARTKLAELGIDLPRYRRSGALLLAVGRGFEVFDTCNFNPHYLARFFGLVELRAAYGTSDQQIRDDLRGEALKYPRHRPILDYVFFFSPRVIIKSLLIALLIRTFLFQPFSIPSQSMVPTLLVGDYLLVSKYSYGYTHYSLPLSLPVFTGRIMGQPIDRGDVVVFRLPNNDYWIKRVVGLPGDHIQMINGMLNINGQPVKRERIEDYDVTDMNGWEETVKRAKLYRETLPNGATYTTLDLIENGFFDNTQVYTVPPAHYFMMGDNRDNSTDSRELRAVGYVPYENIIGKAQVTFFSIQGPAEPWKIGRWPWIVRWRRLFEPIR